jgi:fumarate hydratase subunit beta
MTVHYLPTPLEVESVRTLRRGDSVYPALGGGCTLLSRAIKEVVSVDWHDLIAHYRLVRLKVEGLAPLMVGIDAHGNSLYHELAESAQTRPSAITAELRAKRSAVPGGGA